MESRQADKLMNEAVKRILLDIVIRGHGDRLIGKWSREPELQEFLEQVPYMLDRINQLHLACSRVEIKQLEHNHHHHHHSHPLPLGDCQSSLNHFMSLVGSDQHWLVRTRDTLGLTPLHKAVLFNNRPVVEYILDRYPDELAAMSWLGLKQPRQLAAGPSCTRIIDAQDKYGRTALHYAAARLVGETDERQHHSNRHLYHFLVAKGASLNVLDFRGKTPAYYIRHPGQLKARSVLHLANKLNASYQANVLTKTLKATSERSQIREMAKVPKSNQEEVGLHSASELNMILDTSKMSGNNRESMSVSCTDLTGSQALPVCDDNDDEFQPTLEPIREGLTRSKSSIVSGVNMPAVRPAKKKVIIEKTTRHSNPAKGSFAENKRLTSPQRQESLLSSESHDMLTIAGGQEPAEEFAGSGESLLMKRDSALKQLAAERCSRQIIDAPSRDRIKRCLKEGVVDKINELIVDGYGSYILNEAQVFCWNLQCKRYIKNVLPKLLIELDRLHESIATNQLATMTSLLNKEPFLARMRRPYKRASMSALHLSTRLDRRALVRYLLERFPELLIQRDSTGATCLHWAARSLKLERLYCWLSENFNSQLEQLRDHKGKRAADYRQQAIRMASFEFSKSPVHGDATLGVEDILKETQIASDKLHFTGSKAPLNSRSKGGRGEICSIREKGRLPSELSDGRVSSVELNSGSAGGQEEAESYVDAEVLPSSNILLTRGDPMQRGLEEATPGEAVGTELRMDRNNSPDSSGGDMELDANKKRPAAVRYPSQTSSEEIRGENLLGDLAQLVGINNDSSELTEGKKNVEIEPTEVESPLATPSLPFSRPQSASNSGRLECIIVEAIRNCDYKKLNHLILAGCGERMLQIYSSLLAELASNEISRAPTSVVSGAEMQNFFTITTRDYLRTIEKIHLLLHKCYAQSEQADVNKNFIRFCTLLNRKRLIMCRDAWGACPLHVALLRADTRIIDYLLRRHPESASAPDHQLRNALHYAGIVLHAYNHHGPFKITSNEHTDESQLSGYWTIDDNAKLIYDNLLQRYEELTRVKDKRGCTSGDYLTSEYELEHVNLGDQAGQLIPASILRGCCENYSKMLDNYNYKIFVDAPKEPEVVQNNSPEDILLEISDQHSEVFSGKQRSFEKSKSLETTPKELENQRELNSEKVKRSTYSKDNNSPARSRTSENLLRHLDVELPPVSGGDGGGESVRLIQMAPKPTVGSDIGFPLSPTRLEPGESSKRSSFSSNHSSSSRRSKRQGSPTLNLDLDAKILDPGKEEQQHRNHHGHHHHHHHRFHHVHRRPSNSTQSIVGGVIVPTIIHNDKMDEIETYDIIYRQPPASPAPQSSCSESSFSGEEIDGGRKGGVRGRNHRQRQHKNGRGKSPRLVDGGGGSSDSRSTSSASGDSGSELGDDDNDRVERLSNEFENRVRREKDELKAKVDQIMNEIKAGAKSGKSARFLSSPMDEHQRPSGGAGPTVMFTLESSSGRNIAGKSLSSSGHSSLSSSSRTSYTTGTTSTSTTTTTTTTTTRTTTGSSGSASSASSSSSSYSSKSSLGSSNKHSKESVDAKVESATTQKTKSRLDELAGQLVSKNTYGQTYLHFIASRSQSPSTFYKVLNHGNHLVGERDIFYRTARDVALQFNLANNVQVLDKFIIDLFIGSQTNLLWQLLLQGYSPLIHVSDSDGNDVMLILKLLKLDRTIHFLLQMADFQRWRDELHTFIRHGYSAGVSELILKHRDLVRAKSTYSRTSLHLAVLFDRIEMVHELLEREPTSVHCTDNMGRTALHYTYGLSNSKNMLEIREKLIYAGGSIDVRDVKMRTPKYYYIFKREIEDIKRIELELN